MYGLDDERTRSYGMRLLRARRLVERAVRFVQVFIEHQIWDNHLNLDRELGYACAKTDKPVAALIKDLKQRGLLDDTLVIWGGEFGRMPLAHLILYRDPKQGEILSNVVDGAEVRRRSPEPSNHL